MAGLGQHGGDGARGGTESFSAAGLRGVGPLRHGRPRFHEGYRGPGPPQVGPAQPGRKPEVREDRTRDAECGSYARPGLHAEKLKEVYQKRIQERPDFNDVGFFLTDYCTDFYDGKQLTVATYMSSRG